MGSIWPGRPDVKVHAVKEALSRIGEEITEAQARIFDAREDCECKEGVYALAPSRRHFFAGAGLVAGVGIGTPRSASAKAPPGAVEYPVPVDSTKEPGRMMGADGGYGSRSQFETEIRWANPARTASFSPLQYSYGTITRRACTMSAIMRVSGTSIRCGIGSLFMAWSTGQ
jgi:sulfane dehydrogenase subunit SoxC